jgi:hypothetical protein
MYIAGNDGTDLALAAEIRVEVDGVPGSNDMPGRILLRTTPDGSQSPVDAVKVDSAQNVTVFSGNLIIGTSGKGIDFSATPGTGTSELLADYEEGTWTPTTFAYGPGGAVPTFTSFTSSGNYTKIGREVFVTGVISWTGTSGGATFFGISGLPFSINPNTMQGTMEFDDNFGSSLGVAEAIWNAGLRPRTFSGSAVAQFKFGYASSGGTNVVTDLNCTALLNTTANLRFALTYIV